MPKRKCVLCQKSKDSSQCRSLSSCSYGWYHEYLKEKGTSFDDNDLFLCSSCVYDFYKLKTSCIESDIPVTTDSSNIEPMDTTTIEDDNDLALDNVIYGGSSQNHCIICRQERDHVSDMITVPKPARLDLLIIHKLYVPHGVRCCGKHLLSSSRLDPEEVINMDNRQQLKVALPTEKLVDLVGNLLTLIEEAIRSPRLDSCDSSLSSEDFEAWTGWKKDQFECMLEEVTPYLRSSTNRNPIDSLAIFWIKLKTNLSFRQIGSLFNFSGNIFHCFSNVCATDKGESKTPGVRISLVLYLYSICTLEYWSLTFSP